MSFVLPTHNRREVLLHTLEQIEACGLRPSEFETFVVDNASTDGTADAVREMLPHVRLLRHYSNRGPCAKNSAIPLARGEYLVFLDDDSYPEPGSVGRMIRRFEGDATLGAAVFNVTLPDGSRECSAYPDVCIGCGTGFRRSALEQVGGLPDDFFMAAEEYDLSLRLMDAGWKVCPFHDLHVSHQKSPASRFPGRIARLDARNNTLLAMRYFPEPWRMRYATEWLERYRLMAGSNHRRVAFWAGAISGMVKGIVSEHRPIGAAAFEQFAKIEQTFTYLAAARERLGLRRILLADLGKNILAYRLAAERCGLEVVGVADNRLGGRGLAFRGMPLLSDVEALRLRFDAVVVSNLSWVHAPLREAAWRRLGRCPALDLFAREHRALDPVETCIPSRTAA